VFLTSVLLLVLLTTVNAQQKLIILHTNDTHSQIDPIRVGRNAGLGGVERRLQFIDSIRTQYGKENVLLLDGGDYNQGTPYFTMAKGDLEVELCNALGYDAATIGNHELDNGQKELARRLKMARHQTLTCNYDLSKTPLKKYVKPYTIIKRAGYKIGIIGVAPFLESNVLRSSLDNVVRLNTVDEVNKWADFLKNKKKCDLVILLSHLGFNGGDVGDPSDIVMVENSRNLDIVIGGHSHTYLRKAKEVKDLDGRIVPITQCGGQGMVVGMWEITPSRP